MLSTFQDFVQDNTITIADHQSVVFFGEQLFDIFLDGSNIRIILGDNSTCHIFEVCSKQNNSSIQNIIVEQQANSNFKWFKFIDSSQNGQLRVNIIGNNTNTEILNLIIPKQNTDQDQNEPELTPIISLNQSIFCSHNNNRIWHQSKAIQSIESKIDLLHRVNADYQAENLTVNQQLQVINSHQKASQQLQPILEIQTPDVVCSHSASISAFEAQSLLYLQSRGLNDSQTNQILTSAFVQKMLDNIEILCIREVIMEAIVLTLNPL